MNLVSWLRPQETIEEEDVTRGLRMIFLDGMFAQVLGILTSGAFLVAFMLTLGASNKVIGLVAAVGPLCQLLQIPAVALIDKLRWRKAVTIIGAVINRIVWLPIAAVPFILPEAWQIPAVFVGLFIYFGVGNVVGCAWNSWLRDFIPEKIMGSYFGRRMAWMTALGAVLTLACGVGIDHIEKIYPNAPGVYSVLFAVAAVVGLTGLGFLWRTPEPIVHKPQGQSLGKMLIEPFRDVNFRRLVVFLGMWGFAINLAAPFFVVYMLQRLKISMSVVLALSVLSQAMNAIFFQIWGKLSDRLSDKSILSASGFMFLFSIFLFPFTTMPEKHVLTYPLLVVIHVLAGISTAGVALCAGNMALKFSPRGRATSYLAANAITTGVTATLAPIIAGFAADWFEKQSLTVAIRWTVSGLEQFSASPLDFGGLDFLFMLSVATGLYAMHRLALVHEEGQVHERVVLKEAYAEIRSTVRHLSNVGGMRYITYLPYSLLRRSLRSFNRFGDKNGSKPPVADGENGLP